MHYIEQTIRARSYFFLSFFLFWGACTNGFNSFNGESKKDQKSEDQREPLSENEDAEEPDEPVMVGGAYLHCGVVEQREDSQETDVGCGIGDQSYDKKYNIPRDSEWQVTDERGNSQEIEQRKGAKDEQYHQYFLRVSDFRSKKIAVKLKHRGKIQSYEKPLSSDLIIEKNRNQAEALLDKFSFHYHGEPKTNAPKTTQDKSAIEAFIKGLINNTQSSGDSHYCQNSLLNSNKTNGRFDSVYPLKGEFLRNAQYPCFLNSWLDGGCMIIVVRNSDVTKAVIVEPAGQNISILQKATAQFQCR